LKSIRKLIQQPKQQQELFFVKLNRRK